VRDEMVEFCRSTRGGGVATGLLTNNAAEFADFWRPLLPLDELFDDVVDSSEVGLRKPDPRIYELALERLGTSAAETAFIDDAPGNVDAARRAGLNAVLIGPHPTDEPAAIAALTALLA
jgi:epoxide hydrolase-like predicted phosphatase